MKKIIIVAMLGVILLSGCGANDQSLSPPQIEESTPKESITTLDTSTPNTLLSETSDKKIAIYGVQDRAQKDIFSSLDVVINGATKRFTCFNIEELYAYKSLGIISITFGLILLILSGFIREKRSPD